MPYEKLFGIISALNCAFLKIRVMVRVHSEVMKTALKLKTRHLDGPVGAHLLLRFCVLCYFLGLILIFCVFYLLHVQEPANGIDVIGQRQ